MRTAPESDELLVIGNGGFAAEVFSWATAAFGQRPMGFVVRDEDDRTSPVSNVNCYAESEVAASECRAFIAIGDPVRRQTVVEALKKKSNLRFPNLVHGTAIVDSTVVLGEGNLVLPNAIVCPLVQIGSFNILNIYASLGHEAELGDFNTLSPYATLNGGASCEHLCFLGSHATLGPRVQMGGSAKLSANSFGRKNIPSGGLAFGVPGQLAPPRVNK